MRKSVQNRQQQRGAIAVMTGLLMMLVLIPVAGLVLDLGHLYIVKSELQNLADASALAAAKDLDNSTAGVNKAVVTGKALAAKNRYDFNSTLTLQDANFRFAATPEGPWYSLADTQSNPTGRTFVEIDTRSGGYGGTSTSINTYLMRIAGNNTTSTYGSAVAGRFVNTVTPIGICAVDPTTRNASYSYGSFTELVEFGFRRGVTYNVFALGSLGGASSDPYQINPVNSPPNACSASNSSANVTAPFMCVGNSAVLPTGVGQVYTNTGMTASLDKALNSRFNDFSGGSQCDPSSAPPDVNIREYPCKAGSGDCVNNNSNTIATTPPIDWMESGLNNLPSQMGISTVTSGSLSTPRYATPAEASTASAGAKVWPTVTGVARLSSGAAPFANYGPLWSYGRPVQSNGSTLITPAEANGTIGTNVVNTDKLMYGQVGAGVTDYLTVANYPTVVGNGFSVSDAPAPYNQSGNGNYFLAPTGRPGVVDRRILNIVLVDCRTPPLGSGSCGVMNAVGIGKFFMQRKADFSGSPKKLWVEFTGLVEPVPTSEVKLYK